MISVNLLVGFLLDALLDVPEWGFDPDSFCCLEWSWVLRVLWDIVLYPWCGLVGFLPTFVVTKGDLFLLCQKTILDFELKVGYKLISIFKTIMGLSTKDGFSIIWHPLSPVSYFRPSAKFNSPPTKLPTFLWETPTPLFAWSVSRYFWLNGQMLILTLINSMWRPILFFWQSNNKSPVDPPPLAPLTGDTDTFRLGGFLGAVEVPLTTTFCGCWVHGVGRKL